MLREGKMPNKISDTPRDKPQGERGEHANHDRPGAQAHPRAPGRGWAAFSGPRPWRT